MLCSRTLVVSPLRVDKKVVGYSGTCCCPWYSSFLALAPPAPEGWDKDITTSTGIITNTNQYNSLGTLFIIILVLLGSSRCVHSSLCYLLIIGVSGISRPRPRPRRVGIKTSQPRSAHTLHHHPLTSAVLNTLVVIIPLPCSSC